MFGTGRPFQPSLMLAVIARSIQKSGAPESNFTWVLSDFTSKHYTWLEEPIRDKDPCKFGSYESNEEEKGH